MKRIAAIIVTLAIYPAISYAAQEAIAVREAIAAQKAAAVQKPVGRVYVMSGNVTVSRGSKTIIQVNVSEPIVPGMLIKTGEKSASLLKFEDGQVVTLQSSTTFQVRDYRYDAMQIENSNIDFVFYEGGVHFVTGLIGRKKRVAFSLLTPRATIRGGQAEFAVVKVDNLIYSRVLAGNIRVTNSAGTANFKTGDSPVVTSSLALASGFYTKTPQGIFNELLSIPVIAPSIIEPALSPEPAPVQVHVPAPVLVPPPASLPVIVPAPAPAPVVSPEPALVTEPVPVASPEPALVPEPASSSAPAPAPAPVLLPAPLPVLVPAPVPVVSPEPAPVPEPASSSEPAPVPTPAYSPEPASTSVSASVLVPAQVPTCTCTCTDTCTCTCLAPASEHAAENCESRPRKQLKSTTSH